MNTAEVLVADPICIPVLRNLIGPPPIRTRPPCTAGCNKWSSACRPSIPAGRRDQSGHAHGRCTIVYCCAAVVFLSPEQPDDEPTGLAGLQPRPRHYKYYLLSPVGPGSAWTAPTDERQVCVISEIYISRCGFQRRSTPHLPVPNGARRTLIILLKSPNKTKS
ncbi:hypothetical protein GGR56DRAFT_59060 [Xylariaceae sp. FL0804]|nr:hypothetical protein GGR56DRAFT_59060 [Xylariaceae sp. FL0804]